MCNREKNSVLFSSAFGCRAECGAGTHITDAQNRDGVGAGLLFLKESVVVIPQFPKQGVLEK